MSDRTDNGVHLDHVHTYAVCQGIGERMRDQLRRDWAEPAPNLKALFARLPELDLEKNAVHRPLDVGQIDIAGICAQPWAI